MSGWSSLTPPFDFLALGIMRKPIKARRAEALVAAQQVDGFPDRFRGQLNGHRPSNLRSGDQTSIVKDVEMLHHRRQLDRERFREFADRGAPFVFEPGKDCPPRGVDKGSKGPVESGTIVHHLVNYRITARIVNPATP